RAARIPSRMQRATKRRVWKRVVFTALVVGTLTLSALALWTNRLVRQAELDFPELGRTVAVDGIDMHYVERGRGRTIVLVHGAFGAAQDYTATIFDPLTRQHRVIAFDRPGHGYSQRPRDIVCTPAVQARILHDAIVALGVERPV